MNTSFSINAPVQSIPMYFSLSSPLSIPKPFFIKQEGEEISIKLPKDSQQDLIYQSKKRVYRVNIGDNWSGPFDVENVEDFDLKVQIKNVYLESQYINQICLQQKKHH